MLSHDEELESRANGPEMPPCVNCGHEAHVGMCEEMVSVRLLDEECGNSTCCCKQYKPMDAEDFLDQEKI